MKNENANLEIIKFIFCIIIIGYNVQLSMNRYHTDFFENGAMVYNFFLLLFGILLADSIEKTHAEEKQRNFFIETMKFMRDRLKVILPAHIVAVVAVIIMTLACDLGNAGSIILKGLPSIFLLQGGAVWYDAHLDALIVSEWIISSSLIAMLFMFPVGLLLRKYLNGFLMSMLQLPAGFALMLVFALPFNLNDNAFHLVWAWLLIDFGMFAYYLAEIFKQDPAANTQPHRFAYIMMETVGYFCPIMLCFPPLPDDYQIIIAPIVVIAFFTAMSVTPANVSIPIKNEKFRKILTYIGSLSFAMFMFHPVIIKLLDYVYIGCPLWVKMLIVFPSSIALAVAYKYVCLGCRKAIARIKAAKQNKTVEADTEQASEKS